MKKKICAALTLMVLALFVTICFAEEMTMEGKPGMDEAMMAKMKEYGMVNENHKLLEYFIGEWEYSMKWWMAPDTTPEISEGASEIEWIMDGRFIEQYVEGTAMGELFMGRGTIGYDNIKKKYVFSWLDNMGTGIMTATADYDPAAKAFTEMGKHSCPISPTGEREYKAITKILDDDTYSYEVYTNDENGVEFKSMEIIYSRF